MNLESKVKLLYNKGSKELTLIMEGVEPGDETYESAKKLVQDMIEIELKKIVYPEIPSNPEDNVDIIPVPENIKNPEPKENKDISKKEEVTSDIDEKPSETDTSSAAESVSSNNEAEIVKEDTTVKEAETTPSVNNPENVNTTFAIKPGETQLNVKDFAEAHNLFQPKFMANNKFRVNKTEVHIYESAGYCH